MLIISDLARLYEIAIAQGNFEAAKIISSVLIVFVEEGQT